MSMKPTYLSMQRDIEALQEQNREQQNQINNLTALVAKLALALDDKENKDAQV